MISPDETVLLGISGGKDSLALAVALRERLRWVPVRYKLEAVQLEWNEYPQSTEEREAVDALFDGLDLPLGRIIPSLQPESFRGKFDCYLCSRNKKRMLFEIAEQMNCRTVALGHHLDDFVETTIMNLCFQGQFATIMPVQEFFEGRFRIIRPLCEIEESRINALATRLNLPIVSAGCPNRDSSVRAVVKDVIRTLSRYDRRVRKNIYRSPWHINHEYLPTRLYQE